MRIILAIITKIQLGLFFLLFLSIFFWPPYDQLKWQPQFAFFDFNYQPFRILIVVSACLALIMLFARKRWKTSFFTLTCLVILMLLECLPSRTSTSLLVQFSLPMIISYTLAGDNQTAIVIKKYAVPFLILLGSLDAAIGVLESFDPKLLNFITSVYWAAGTGIASIFGEKIVRVGSLQWHPVVFGAIMLIPATLSLHKVITSPNFKVSVIMGVALAISLAGLFLSFSRGSWLAFCIITVLIFVSSMGKHPYKTAIVLIALGVVIFFVREQLFGRWAELGSSTSMSHRLLMYQWVQAHVTDWLRLFTGYKIDVIKVLAAHPPADKFTVIDNIYMSLFIQYGLIGLVVIMSLIFSPLIRVEKSTLQGVRFAVLALSLSALTFDILYWQCTTIAIGILVGLLWGDFEQQKSDGTWQT